MCLSRNAREYDSNLRPCIHILTCDVKSNDVYIFLAPCKYVPLYRDNACIASYNEFLGPRTTSGVICRAATAP